MSQKAFYTGSKSSPTIHPDSEDEVIDQLIGASNRPDNHSAVNVSQDSRPDRMKSQGVKRPRESTRNGDEPYFNATYPTNLSKAPWRQPVTTSLSHYSPPPPQPEASRVFTGRQAQNHLIPDLKPDPACAIVMEQLRAVDTLNFINEWCKKFCKAIPSFKRVNEAASKAVIYFETPDIARKVLCSTSREYGIVVRQYQSEEDGIIDPGVLAAIENSYEAYRTRPRPKKKRRKKMGHTQYDLPTANITSQWLPIASMTNVPIIPPQLPPYHGVHFQPITRAPLPVGPELGRFQPSWEPSTFQQVPSCLSVSMASSTATSRSTSPMYNSCPAPAPSIIGSGNQALKCDAEDTKIGLSDVKYVHTSTQDLKGKSLLKVDPTTNPFFPTRTFAGGESASWTRERQPRNEFFRDNRKAKSSCLPPDISPFQVMETFSAASSSSMCPPGCHVAEAEAFIEEAIAGVTCAPNLTYAPPPTAIPAPPPRTSQLPALESDIAKCNHLLKKVKEATTKRDKDRCRAAIREQNKIMATRRAPAPPWLQRDQPSQLLASNNTRAVRPLQPYQGPTSYQRQPLDYGRFEIVVDEEEDVE